MQLTTRGKTYLPGDLESQSGVLDEPRLGLFEASFPGQEDGGLLLEGSFVLSSRHSKSGTVSDECTQRIKG